MDPHALFPIANYSVLPAWLLLAIVPRWRWSGRVALLTSLGLSLFYTILVVAHWGEGEGSMGSLSGVQKLLSHEWITLYAWVHYLAFDLMVGAWEARDAQRLGLHQAWLIPCLGLTLMLGPAGLLLYLTVRGALRRRLWPPSRKANRKGTRSRKRWLLPRNVNQRAVSPGSL